MSLSKDCFLLSLKAVLLSETQHKTCLSCLFAFGIQHVYFQYQLRLVIATFNALLSPFHYLCHDKQQGNGLCLWTGENPQEHQHCHCAHRNKRNESVCNHPKSWWHLLWSWLRKESVSRSKSYTDNDSLFLQHTYSIWKSFYLILWQKQICQVEQSPDLFRQELQLVLGHVQLCQPLQVTQLLQHTTKQSHMNTGITNNALWTVWESANLEATRKKSENSSFYPPCPPLSRERVHSSQILMVCSRVHKWVSLVPIRILMVFVVLGILVTVF